MPPSASFRDPGGRVVIRDGRVLRQMNDAGRECLDAALGSATVQSLTELGHFVKTTVLSPELAEHEAIPFPSFPYEWPPEMLAAAAALTLDLAEGLAGEHLGLKDATPFNILFRGAEPVFIDVLSVERRDPHDPIWLARAQFVRTFLLPLAAARHFGIPLGQTFAQREGIEPDAFYRMLTPAQRLLPRYVGLVTMPVWLAAKQDPDDASLYRPRHVDDAEKCAFILGRNFTGLRRSLRRLTPQARDSVWSEYMGEKASSYTREQFAEKETFVTAAIREAAPRRVLDVGANTGHFSAIAARSGAAVVAIDSDEAVAGAIWRRARADQLDILPLVVNLAQPTPALGWRNRECPSFLDRSIGQFDLVMMLAVVHHMLATERVPLEEIVALASELTTDWLLIEFVAPEDPMFRRISRGRDALYAYLNAALFERAARERFDIVRQRKFARSERTLYLLRKKPA